MEEHSRKKLDLTGQRFGKLTVLRPAENIGVRTAWLCRSDCGSETVVKTCHLRSGKSTSCGCKGHGFNALTYVDGTCVEMLQAKTIRKNNTSGVPGVYWEVKKRMWRASICFKGKRYSLGRHRRFEDAVRARKRAEEALHDKFLSEYAQQEGAG